MKPCPICRSFFKVRRHGRYCSKECRWESWRLRSGAEAQAALALPEASVPPELLGQIPPGPAAAEVAIQLIIMGRAPAGARGYRVGTCHGNFYMLRWFPSLRRRRFPVFSLEPFEQPLVPEHGLYVILYVNERGAPIGGPRFTLKLGRLDPGVRFCDGDRSLQPRLRA